MQRLLDFFARRFLVLYFLTAIVLLIGLIPRASAEVSGNTLFSDCSAKEDSVEFGRCIGFVAAVTDVADGAAFCIPPGKVTYRQVKDIVMKFLTDQPALRSHAAYELTAAVLSAYFPCEQAPKTSPKPGVRGA
jgi:hypothetical protein